MKIQKILKLLKLDETSRDVLIGIAIVALIGINVVISGIPIKLDMSRGKAYSLSPSTVTILKNLKQPVEITFFVSDNMPASFLTAKNQVGDLLTEYRKSSSKITLKTIDPKKDQKAAASAAQDYGIQETQFSAVENDQFAVSAGYFSLGVKANDTKSAIQRIDPTTLEYNISSIIYKMTQGQDVRVGMVGGQGANLTGLGGGGGESMSVLQQILGQQMNVEEADLANLTDPPKTLIVLDGQMAPLDEKAVGGLSNYLAKGGKAIVFTSGLLASDALTAAPTESKLNTLLAKYGITINDDLVLSNQSEIINFGSDAQSRMIAKYPFWITTNVFNPDASYTSNVSSLTFPWVSSITLGKRTGISQKEIVRSTEQSWVLTGSTVDLKPQSIIQPKVNQIKQSILIAYAKDQKSKSELMVIPSIRFIQDNYLGRSGNLEFIVNLVNEFASDGALAGIRSRAITTLPLPSLDANSKDMFKWANMIALPALLGLFGLLRIRTRDKSTT